MGNVALTITDSEMAYLKNHGAQIRNDGGEGLCLLPLGHGEMSQLATYPDVVRALHRSSRLKHNYDDLADVVASIHHSDVEIMIAVMGTLEWRPSLQPWRNWVTEADDQSVFRYDVSFAVAFAILLVELGQLPTCQQFRDRWFELNTEAMKQNFDWSNPSSAVNHVFKSITVTDEGETIQDPRKIGFKGDKGPIIKLSAEILGGLDIAVDADKRTLAELAVERGTELRTRQSGWAAITREFYVLTYLALKNKDAAVWWHPAMDMGIHLDGMITSPDLEDAFGLTIYLDSSFSRQRIQQKKQGFSDFFAKNLLAIESRNESYVVYSGAGEVLRRISDGVYVPRRETLDLVADALQGDKQAKATLRSAYMWG